MELAKKSLMVKYLKLNSLKILLINNYKFLFLLLLILFLIKPVITIYENRVSLFQPGYKQQFKQYEKAYYSSQFVQKKSTSIIPDEVFRSFAGGAFLYGLNPILITHDHPPLGNYIISLSILLFDNPRTIIVLMLILIGLGIFLIGKEVTGSTVFSLLPVGIFINEALFLNKLKFAPLVEPIQLPFILFAFYFFIRGVNSKHYLKWFILTSLFLGAVISIRFFVTGAVITFCMLFFLILDEKKISKKFLTFVFSLPLSLVVLIVSYTRTIMDGYSILQIFGIQKYILKYHSSKFILPFSFWDLLLFNRWHTWWGTRQIISDPQWLITWPISVILTFIHLLGFIIRKLKLNKAEKIILIWLLIYTLTLSTGYSSTNYFLSIIPFFYILSISFLRKMFFAYFLKNK